MAGRGGADWFEREEFIGQISDIRVQNLQVEREVVQKRTFTRWMNLHLEKASPPLQVQDLFQDIQDGHILMVLLEELSGCSLVQGFRKSSHRIFRLNNIAKVLSFLEERNVKLVSIDAADVADGNSSIILGLIWNIILFFQIKELTGNIRSQFPSSCSLSSVPTSWDSGADAPSEERRSGAVMENHKAIRKLLQWVQRRTRKYGVAVQDFGRSWTSGLAFLALIKSIDSSLVDMRKALLRSPRDNLEDAFRTAHFSLGIPRLLEPEDVAVSAPDEQSFIMYVSQFLEHFPDIQQPEDNHRPVERSISMERLNLRDASLEDLQHRPHMFQRDQPHPKVWISSASEDRSVTTPRLRTHAARSWSTEDFLSSSTHTDVSRDVVEQLGFQSPSSLACDSAISSPDSWVDGDLLPESQGDGSLWEVYRATPVDVMPLDEGFLSSMEDRAPDEPSTPGSYVEELENIHRPSGDNQGLKVHETNLENQDQILELDPGTDLTSDPTDTNITEERDMDVRQLQKHSKPCSEDMTSPSQEDFLEQHFTSVIRASPHLEDPGQTPHLEDPGQTPHLEDPGQTPHLEDPGQTPHLQKKTDSEQLGCQEMISPSEDKRPSRNEPETSKERKDGVDMQDEELTGDIQISGRTSSTEATDQSSLSIPLISIWDSDDQVEDRVHEPGPPDTDLEDRVSKLDQGEIAAQQRSYDCEGTTEDVSGPQDPDGLSHIWDEDVLVYIKPRPEQPMILEYLDDVDEAEPESLSAPDDPQTRMDLNKTTLDHDGPNGPADGDQDTRTNGSSDMETRNSHHMSGPNTSQPTDQSLSRTVDLFYSDSGRGTPTEDLLGDPVEPMDLFYPDKEEPVFTESADTEMQRWPSVLSVSALQPAPASDDSAEVQKPDLLGDIFAGLEETDNVTRQTNQEPTDTPASQDQCVMCGVAIRGPAGELPRPESPEDSREVQDSISRHRGSSSTAEIQVQPVLLPRKGVCLSEPLFSLRAASGTSDPPTDLWNWELRLLLLLWLLLYLLWLLPQVDLYQLLLNLEP